MYCKLLSIANTIYCIMIHMYHYLWSITSNSNKWSPTTLVTVIIINNITTNNTNNNNKHYDDD